MRSVELIIRELGPESQDVSSVAATGDASWVVQFENDAEVHLACRQSPPRLELMAPVASLPTGLEEDAMRALLMFNFLSADTGGARMSLSATNDAVFLVRDLPEAELSLVAVQQALRELAELAARWATVLSAGGSTPDAAAHSIAQSTHHP